MAAAYESNKSNKTVGATTTRWREASGRTAERERGSEEGGKGERARYSTKVKREEGERRYKQKNRAKERDGARQRRTATRPDRPVAQPARVYLALLQRAADSSRFSLINSSYVSKPDRSIPSRASSAPNPRIDFPFRNESFRERNYRDLSPLPSPLPPLILLPLPLLHNYHGAVVVLDAPQTRSRVGRYRKGRIISEKNARCKSAWHSNYLDY